MICHDCDSPDCSWHGQHGDTHFYRCNVCGEFTVGPDPYCVPFDFLAEEDGPGEPPGMIELEPGVWGNPEPLPAPGPETGAGSDGEVNARKRCPEHGTVVMNGRCEVLVGGKPHDVWLRGYEVWTDPGDNGDWTFHREFSARGAAVSESTRLNLAGGRAIVREVWSSGEAS